MKSPDALDNRLDCQDISWFHSRVQEPIKPIKAIKTILEEYGYHIEQVTTRDPGEIIYEVGFQVAAKPRKKTT